MNSNDTPNLNYTWGAMIVEELVRNGVRRFHIAPGSRSSPLTVAAANNPNAETIIHYDERGLAFFALGQISVTKQPVVLICSSGTAAVNFFPAVVEASKKKLPLLVLTADRPPELRDTGAMQTIHQVGLYGGYARWQVDLPAPDINLKPAFVLTTIDQALFRAVNPMPGPVQINCMFREPLAPDPEDNFDAGSYLAPVKNWLTGKKVFTHYTTGETSSDIASDNRVVSIIKKSETGIIVVGKLASPKERQAVIKLSQKLKWPVFPDIVSGLRTNPHNNIIHYYDQVLLSNEAAEKYPVDTVLHLGGRITSKRWYQYIEKNQPENYITVLNHSLRNDPLHTVSVRIKSRVLDFIETILPALHAKGNDEMLRFLREASQRAGQIVEEFASSGHALNEISAARTISRLIPGEQGIFLSNSMPVRDFDMYAAPGEKHIEFGANRGASGIDGIIASACGFAHAIDTPTTLVTGDLAFLHDLNSLTLDKYLKKPIIIVVLNNDGGAIFSFLPIARSSGASDIFDSHFGTPHGLNFCHAAQMFRLDYHTPESLPQFTYVYKKALAANHSTIIEVKSKRDKNYNLHLNLQEKIRISMDKMVK
ncbi:MAG: 2-succinyl-5-enolpyruvyl-6-hydroxy-3-cyclohexene-1-carboxylic-acid synthase [bacterium]|nr:2-succinyl-5-enolpyruvyl-6-hydroxy-3-cyclohexene-1-carboxylic-acid synthase [bacterium]